MDKRSIVNMTVLLVAIAAISFLVFWGIRNHNGDSANGSKANIDGVSEEEDSGGQVHAELLDDESLKEDKGEQVIYVPKNEISSFFMTDSNGILLNFEKRDDKWIYLDDEGFELNQERIDKILNYLCDIRAVEFLEKANGEEYGLNQDSKTYTLVDASNDKIIVSIGNKDEKTGRVFFAINYDFSTIYVNSGKLNKVSEYSVEELLKL